MKGHTGVTMLLGKGAISSWSMKQKLNTKSSTETKLIVVDDTMPYVLWTTYFLEAQGYGVANAELYQDHLSAMMLEKNDKVDSGEVKISHCGTEDMAADYFTKPLQQGAQFKKFRKMILNLED
eukprot:1125017-Ditylum_brightwellii.AAC.1